jgi:4-alpha-glucanotransferase
MKQHGAGILLHITSLPNQYPIGDLGPCAYQFADFVAKAGQSWWQMLPVNTSGNFSPYQPLSAFGGDPLLLSPDHLVEQGLLKQTDLPTSSDRYSEKVNFQRAQKLKIKLLHKAFKNFESKNDSAQIATFESFIQTEKSWLDDLVLFQAIKDNEGSSDWTLWDSDLSRRVPAALVQARKDYASEIRYYQFLQWLFALQWQALRAYCNKKGIGLIGDIPLFVAHESADVWAHPEIFKLNSKGRPTVVAGVPPDYFSNKGQLWGVPVYRWDVLKKQNYAWWLQRLQINLQRFDMLRLDHFIGFIRTYEISAKARTARKGVYHHAAGLPFFKCVFKKFGVLPFIADDLGNITPEVEKLRDQFNMDGMKILQFELENSLQTGKPVKSFPIKTVAYTGTHDNDTSRGWFQKLTAKQRKKLCVELDSTNENFNWTMIKMVLKSRAALAIIPLQDFLNLGSKARMNVPGEAFGNWGWRYKKNLVTDALAAKMRKLTQLCR